MKLPVLFQRPATVLLPVAAAALMAACASSSGIDTKAQRIDPASVGLASGPSDAATAVRAQWWRDLGDASLDALVERALAGNPTLGVAQARLDRATAAIAGQEADGGVKVGFSADTTRQHFSANSIYPAPLGGSTRTLANAQFAGSWEFDFFGRHRASIDAAVGGARAAEAELAAARQLLATQMVQAYVQLALLRDQRVVAERALQQRQELLGLVRQRVAAGLDTKIELRQGEGALPDTRQQIEQIDEKINATRLALAALTAQPPTAVAGLAPSLAALKPIGLPQAVPADLLGRRADIAAARWRIESATQGVQAAKAQFYPNVNLSVFAGLASIGLDELVKSGSRQYGIGPAIHLPIFDSGALRANLGVRTADLDTAVQTYNVAVVDAVRETADQLNTLQSVARQQAEQVQAQAAAESAYDIARQRYRAGLTSQLVLIQAETAVLTQRRLALDLQARALAAQAALARALGGGYAPQA